MLAVSLFPLSVRVRSGGAGRSGVSQPFYRCRNGEFDKVQRLVQRGAPVNFKFVSRQPKMRPYPLHVAVFRNRVEIVLFLLGKGSDPMLRNYRKETAIDICKANGLRDMQALLERGPSKVLPDRASTAANRDRNIKEVRKQEQPDESLGPVSKAELVANVAKYKSVLPTNTPQARGETAVDLEQQIRERQDDAREKKEAAIRARKEKERQEKLDEERIYVSSLANAGQDEKKRAAVYLAREEARKKREEQQREWDRQRREEEVKQVFCAIFYAHGSAEQEEGARALEALERKRQLAAKGIYEEDAAAAQAKADFEKREREMVARALAAKQRAAAEAAAAEEAEAAAAAAKKSPPTKPTAASSIGKTSVPAVAPKAAPVRAWEDDDDYVPPPVLAPPPSWSDEEDQVSVWQWRCFLLLLIVEQVIADDADDPKYDELAKTPRGGKAPTQSSPRKQEPPVSIPVSPRKKEQPSA